MGQIHHIPLLVGRPEPHAGAKKIGGALQTRRHLRRTGPGQNADDLTGQPGGGVGGAGVETAGVDHIHGGFFRRLVQRHIRHIVAVGGQQADGFVTGIQTQPPGQIGRDVGNQLQRQNLHRQGITGHWPTPWRKATPEHFFSSICRIRDAIWAPASTAGVPWRWILETTVRADSGTPMRGL